MKCISVDFDQYSYECPVADDVELQELKEGILVRFSCLTKRHIKM
jgi:hypothetical protein